MRSDRARIGFAKLSSAEGWKRLRDLLFVAMLIPSLLPLTPFCRACCQVGLAGPDPLPTKQNWLSWAALYTVQV